MQSKFRNSFTFDDRQADEVKKAAEEAGGLISDTRGSNESDLNIVCLRDREALLGLLRGQGVAGPYLEDQIDGIMWQILARIRNTVPTFREVLTDPFCP